MFQVKKKKKKKNFRYDKTETFRAIDHPSAKTMIFAINPSVVVYTYRRISRRPFVVIVRATKKDKRDSVFYTIEPGSSSCHARVQPRHTRVCIPMQSACDVNGLSVRVLLTPTSEAPEYSRMLIPRHCRFRRQSRLFVISLS